MKLRKTLHRITLLASAALLPGCGEPTRAPSVASYPPTPTTAAVRPATRPRSAVVVSSPIPVVQLHGDPKSLAAHAARQLGPQIRFLQAAYLKQYFRNDTQRQFASAAAMLFATHIRPEHWSEVVALAKETELELADLVLAQCFLDLSPMQACSTIALPASASADGVARMGRNLDFPSFDVADKYSALLVYHPKDAYAFVSIGWPGMIGVLTGMNEHGLTLANMEVTRSGSRPRAMPYPLLYRTVLEKCRTVAEAIDLLRATPRQTPNNLMLADATGDRAVVEITPDRVEVRRAGSDEPLVSTNHQRGNDAATPGRCVRYDTLVRTAGENAGRMGPASLEKLMGVVAQGDMTLQSMVFEPANRVVHLAVGADASSKQYHMIDFSPLFSAAAVDSDADDGR